MKNWKLKKKIVSVGITYVKAVEKHSIIQENVEVPD
jgi:hypothetical protein